MITLYKGNSTNLELQTLTNVVTDVADTGATVTATVKDQAGTEVAGQTWPLTMTHDTGGTYRGTLEFDLDIHVGRTYFVEITATGSGGEKGFWREPATVANRNDGTGTC